MLTHEQIDAMDNRSLMAEREPAVKSSDEKVRRVEIDVELQLADSIIECSICSQKFYFKKGVTIEKARRAEMAAEMTIPKTGISDTERAAIAEMVEAGGGMEVIAQVRHHFVQHRNVRLGKQKSYESLASSRSFPCPHCGELIQIRFRIATVDCVKANDGAMGASALAHEDRALYEEWKKCGLLDLFIEAMRAGSPTNAPQRPDRQVHAIRTWFRVSVGCEIPRRSLARFRSELQTDNLYFYQAQGVVGVVADGHLKTFLPRAAVTGYANKTLVLNDSGASQSKDWHRTRYGYVVGRGVAFQALQVESKAAMGSATQKQRGTK